MRRTRLSLLVLGCMLAALLSSCASSQSPARYWGGHKPSQPTALAPLPPPASVPQGTGAKGAPGWLAVQLSSASTADAERPLVLAALTGSGFSVNGGPTISGTSMGIAFDPWEVHLLAELEASHVRFPLDNVGMALQRALPGIDGSAAEKDLIDIVRSQYRQPANQTTQFWSQLIVSLATAAPEPYDLPSADPSAVSLDGVQFQLLMRSAVTAMAAWARSHGAVAVPPKAASPWSSFWGFLQPVDVMAAGNPECTMSEGVLFGQDIAAFAGQSYWNLLTEELAAKFPVAGVYNKVLSATGIMFSYLKLLLTYAELKMDVRIDQSPLVRTLDLTPGQLRHITAHAYYDTGNEQVINCIRWMLILAGMDLAVPQHGDLTTGAIYFRLVKGGGPGGLVEFKLQPGQTSLTVFTDEKGEAKVDVQGQAKKPPLPPNAVPVDRQAQLELVAKAKGGSKVEDTKDLLGSAVVLATDRTAILSIPADILYRTRVFAPTLFTIPVVDHAADYKVDYTLPNGARLTGTKCGGPAGDWELDVTGDYGGHVKWSGLFGVKLEWPDTSAPPKGNVAAVVHGELAGVPATTGKLEYQYTGTAHLDNETLVISITSSGTSTGVTCPHGCYDYAGGFAGATGSLKLPTQMGSFCQ